MSGVMLREGRLRRAGAGGGILGCLLLAGVVACDLGGPPPVDDSTRAMAEELQTLADGLDPERNQFANSAQVAVLSSRLDSLRAAGEEGTTDFIFLEGELADALLYAGHTREAIEVYERSLEAVRDRPFIFGFDAVTGIKEALGLAWLRQGEEDNCLLNHTSASCILPMEGGGIHELEEGSRQAIRYFTEVLEARPGDLNTRWLLNLAYMTLGEHPHGVPEPWVIHLPEENPDTPARPFFEIAPLLGLDVTGLSGGSIVEDFTGNGYLDVMASSWGLRDQLRFFENTGEGRFIDRTDEARIHGITGGLNLVHADFDNSGHPDVLVLRGAWMSADGHHPNSLLRNNGDGTFTDVTVAAGLDHRAPTQTAGWADFNGNGLLDLFIGNESQPGEGLRSELHRNNGDGTFTEVSAQVGIDGAAFVKGVAWGDYTNNGRPDLYLAVMQGPNLLFRNDGPDGDGGWRFTEVAAEAGVQDPHFGFPTWFFDYNNSGYLDLFVSGYRIEEGDLAREYLGIPIGGEYPRLYRNEGDGTFTDVTEDAGLRKVLYTMGSNFGDLDNDGFLDLYLGTGDPDYRTLMPNRAFRNVDGEHFEEVTTTTRLGNIQKGHGVSFADLNHNGQQDLHVVMGGALEGDVYQNLFFENPGTDHGWLALQLEGVEANRSAIGARVRVDLRLPDGTERSVHRMVSAGSSFGGNPFRVHVGLGDAVAIEGIVIEWPGSGLVERLEGVEANRIYQVREGEGALDPLDRPAFAYPLDHGGH